MGSAYTPGLTVSSDIVVRRIRRLPIKGQVLVNVGDAVEPNSVLAQAMLPGLLQTIKLAEKLGVDIKETESLFQLKVGDPIAKGDLIAETKGLFGIFGGQKLMSDYTGTVEAVSSISGQVLVREPSIPVEVTAFIQGKIVDIMPEEGAVVETRGAMVQGIFGIGGERQGEIRIAVKDKHEVLDAHHLQETDAGKLVVGGAGVTLAAMRRASELGVHGLIGGGVRDSDLIELLGYDIGVAITGQEQISFTLVVTEGFGELAMADRTFELLKSVEGKTASINGATQIRAGVIRPEIIVPLPLTGEAHVASAGGGELVLGTPIRVIREPYFGALGTVTGLPPTLEVLESGTEVRVLNAKLASGEEVTVPRANVEIISQ